MTMREVAKRAGVSLATVSRVLSGSTRVRPETAATVQRVIDELNFVPNASAGTLKYGRSDTFGIIFPNVINPYFFKFFRAFEDLLPSKKQGILLANCESSERMANSIRRMITSQVDGVVLIPSDEELGPFYDRLALKNIPVVTIDRGFVRPMVSDISFRFEKGMQEAVDHLYDFGHREIALIGGTATFPTSRMRAESFFSAMSRRSLPLRKEFLETGDYGWESGEACMRRLMELPLPPTAVIAVNDMMALGALRAAHTFGLFVPEDVSIIGSDDIMLTEVVSPTLTTIHLPCRRVAQACLEALQFMKEHPDQQGSQKMIDTWLTVRKSTGPAKTAI